jgi:hypothetical protein
MVLKSQRWWEAGDHRGSDADLALPSTSRGYHAPFYQIFAVPVHANIGQPETADMRKAGGGLFRRWRQSIAVLYAKGFSLRSPGE